MRLIKSDKEYLSRWALFDLLNVPLEIVFLASRKSDYWHYQRTVVKVKNEVLK